MIGDETKKKETQMEKDFVAREERDSLRRMLKRMEAQSDPGDKRAIADLEARFRKANVQLTEGLKQSLLEWRHKTM